MSIRSIFLCSNKGDAIVNNKPIIGDRKNEIKKLLVDPISLFFPINEIEQEKIKLTMINNIIYIIEILIEL